MSLACAVVSAVTVYHYGWAINQVQATSLYSSTRRSIRSTYFVDEDTKLKLSDQENTMVAISSLVVIFCIIEIALAVGSASSSDSSYQPPQENQVSQAC